MTIRDIEAVLAFVLIVGGIALLSIPIALIVGGVLLAVDRATS